MKLQNALNKLAKIGTVTKVSVWYEAKIGTHIVRVSPNGGDLSGEVACISVRRASDKDDIQSDYHAGCFVESVKQAIEYATRWSQDDIARMQERAALN